MAFRRCSWVHVLGVDAPQCLTASGPDQVAAVVLQVVLPSRPGVIVEVNDGLSRAPYRVLAQWVASAAVVDVVEPLLEWDWDNSPLKVATHYQDQ